MESASTLATTAQSCALSSINAAFWLVPVASVIALIFAWRFYSSMKKEEEGTDIMCKIATHVRKGALAYLKQQYKIVAIVFVILVIINAFDGLLDCIIGLTILWAILTLFIYAGKTTPDYIPLIPTNVEQFLYFLFIGTILEIIKIVVIKESVNILVLIQNIEDKIFVKILMK